MSQTKWKIVVHCEISCPHGHRVRLKFHGRSLPFFTRNGYPFLETQRKRTAEVNALFRQAWIVRLKMPQSRTAKAAADGGWLRQSLTGHFWRVRESQAGKGDLLVFHFKYLTKANTWRVLHISDKKMFEFTTAKFVLFLIVNLSKPSTIFLLTSFPIWMPMVISAKFAKEKICAAEK